MRACVCANEQKGENKTNIRMKYVADKINDKRFQHLNGSLNHVYTSIYGYIIITASIR